MTCPETRIGEQAASYCTISSHIGSSSSSNFPLGLPPLKKTSYNKLSPYSPYSLYHHIQVLAIFQLFWLFGQANGKNYNQVQNRTVPQEDQVCLPLHVTTLCLPVKVDEVTAIGQCVA